MKYLLFFSLLVNLLCAESYYEYGKKVTLTKLPESKSVEKSAIRYYKTEQNRIIGIKNEIILSCSSSEACQRVLNKYTLKEAKKLSENFYIILTPPSEELFDLASKLYNEEGVRAAHPNFVKKRFKR